MQLHAASKSSRSWLADGRGAFSSGENLLRYRVSPLVIATDASESGFGVVRSSTLTLRAVTNYHFERYQQPLLVTSWASSSSTPGSAASDGQWSFWHEGQVCMRLPKMIHPAYRYSRWRGPTQSGSRKSPSCDPATLLNSFNPHLTSQHG